MINTLAIENYRSLLKLTVPLGKLNVATGPNGSGKSNFYRALRLLAETAQGGVIHALAHEGGLKSKFWAGPEKISRRMRKGEVSVEGGPRKGKIRLRLGFSGVDFGYSISLGLPAPSSSSFSLDPEVKRECIWAGPVYRLALRPRATKNALVWLLTRHCAKHQTASACEYSVRRNGHFTIRHLYV